MTDTPHVPSPRRTACILTALLFFGGCVQPKGHATTATVTEPWRKILLQSPALGRRTIDVVVPEGYERGSERYPVLVVLDADERTMLRLAITQASYLADNIDGLPEMIIVGIENGEDRLHDMLPAPTGSSIIEFPTAGGANAFGRFILDEALPAVRAQYRTTPTTVLAGFSAGGLFALYSAAAWPGQYDGIIAMDPAIWYNDHHPAVEYADAVAASGRALRLYLAHHGLGDAEIDTTSLRFALRLDSRKPGNVAFAHRRYPDDSHATIALAALPDGLRFVFAPVVTERLPIAGLDERSDATAVLNALTASEREYARGATSLQLPPQLPEVAVNRLARLAGGKLKDAALSVVILRRNVELHPASARAAARLAEGYLAARDTVAAIVEFKRAINLVPSSHTILPEDSRAKLEVLERQRTMRSNVPQLRRQ
jgi:uncharacterized protein